MRYLLPLLLLFLIPACDSTPDEPEGIFFGLIVTGTEGIPFSCTISLSSELGEVTETFEELIVPDGANLGYADVAFATCRKMDEEGELIVELLADNNSVATASTTEAFGSVNVAFP